MLPTMKVDPGLVLVDLTCMNPSLASHCPKARQNPGITWNLMFSCKSPMFLLLVNIDLLHHTFDEFITIRFLESLVHIEDVWVT